MLGRLLGEIQKKVHHPSTGTEEYTRVKLRKDTHFLWTERKQSFCLKSIPCYIGIYSNVLGAFKHYYMLTSLSVPEVNSRAICSSTFHFCACVAQ